MRRLLLHLSIALVAFVVGVTTAMIFGVFAGSPAPVRRATSIYVEPPPMPRSCPNAPKFLHEMPEPPMPPAPPAAPLAPQPRTKGTRIVIRRSDGTTQVTESHTETRVERGSGGS